MWFWRKNEMWELLVHHLSIYIVPTMSIIELERNSREVMEWRTVKINTYLEFYFSVFLFFNTLSSKSIFFNIVLIKPADRCVDSSLKHHNGDVYHTMWLSMAALFYFKCVASVKPHQIVWSSYYFFLRS